MAGELALFEDSAATRRIKILDFDEVKVGKSRNMKVFIRNSSQKWAIRKIESISDNIEGIETDHPVELAPREISPVIITWTPALTIDDPLEADSFFEGELLIKKLV